MRHKNTIAFEQSFYYSCILMSIKICDRDYKCDMLSLDNSTKDLETIRSGRH